jgi:hypothetical protein
MSQSEPSEKAGGSEKGKWEAIISSLVAIATLGFGIFTWWDARTHQKPDEEPKPLVAILKTGDLTPTPTAVEKKAVASQDPLETPQPFKTSKGKLLYHYRNIPLDKTNSQIERAVIVIPAAATQALNCFHTMSEAAQAEGQTSKTLVFVPLFREPAEKPLEDEHIWTRQWDIGGLSVDGKPIGSFQVLDEIYGKLTDPVRFPNLRSVVLIGRHAGAIFINRYVALGNPVIPPRQGGASVDELYVMLSSGYYLYLDRSRPVPQTERFEVPEPADCSDFNHYPFGLDNRPNFLKQLSEQTIRENLFRRRAVYLVGSKDYARRGLVDTCEAKLQGRDRYHRAHFYWLYIRHFPKWKDNVQYQEIEGVEHFTDLIYTSKEVKDVVFGRVAVARTDAKEEAKAELKVKAEAEAEPKVKVKVKLKTRLKAKVKAKVLR